MNLVVLHRRRIAGMAPVGANTFIGGLASTITTKEILATKLGISVSNISKFLIVGNDIEARISVAYSTVDFSATQVTNNLTYYIDSDSNLKSISIYLQKNINRLELNGVTTLFANALRETNVKEAIFPNLTSLSNTGSSNFHFYVCSFMETIYIPECVIFGKDANGNVQHSVNNQIFESLKANCKIYVHPSMETINAGSIEADLAYARDNRSAQIVYVTNKTKPNPITDLSYGKVYSSGVELIFTPPIGNTNNIDYYNVFVNGVFNSKITGSGKYAVNLLASIEYYIEVRPVDVLFNKSTSNILTVSTSNTTITDLDSGEIVGTGIQLIWNTGIYQALEYKVYVNGIYKQSISGSGGYVTGLELATSYDITVRGVDANGEAPVSNSINRTTASTKTYKYLEQLSFYNAAETHVNYHLDGNANDFLGNYNGTPISITYENVGAFNTAKFSGSNAYITLPDLAGYNSTQTIMFWGRAVSGIFYGKGEDGAGGGWGLRLYHAAQKFMTWIVTLNPTVGWNLDSNIDANIDGVKLNHYAFVYNDETNTTTIYINGVVAKTDVRTSSGLRGTGRVFLGKYTNQYLNGNIAAFSITKKALSSANIQEAVVA